MESLEHSRLQNATYCNSIGSLRICKKQQSGQKMGPGSSVETYAKLPISVPDYKSNYRIRSFSIEQVRSRLLFLCPNIIPSTQ